MPEPVLFLTDYRDGPRTGVVLFRGKPHHFDRIFDESADEFVDRYELTPISSELLAKFALQNEMFGRWSDALHAGKTDASTHPGLPGVDEHYKAVESETKYVIEALGPSRFEAAGIFRGLNNNSNLKGLHNARWEVEWLTLNSETASTK